MAFVDTKLTSVSIPNSVTSIGPGAFACTKLISVTVPGGVERIGADWVGAGSFSGGGTFQDCIELTSATLVEGVTCIGACSFEGCQNLTSVTILESVTGIEPYAFAGCKNLTDIYYGGSKDAWLNINGDETSFAYIPLDVLKKIKIHYNSTGVGGAGENPKPDKPDKPDVPAPQEYHVYCNGGSEKFPVSLEDWVKENSSKYHPELAHMLMAMSSSVKSETDMG